MWKLEPKTCHEYLHNMAIHYGVEALCSVVLNDERFPEWSGSHRPTMHHYGRGGLVLHTTEVFRLAFGNEEVLGGIYGYERIEGRKIFLAALFHDAGKMWDYEPDGDYNNWKVTPHKRNIYHLSRSALVWQSAAEKNPAPWLTQEYTDEVLHAILAHHNLREWGSPVNPNSRLAWLIHLSDCLSARNNDCESFDPHSQQR